MSESEPILSFWVVLLSFLWLVYAHNLGAWQYIFKTPGALTAESWAAIFRGDAWVCALAIFFTFIMWGVGRGIFRAFFKDDVPKNPLNQCIFLGLGLGATGSCLFAVGLAGAFSRSGIASIGLIAAVVAMYDFMRGSRRVSLPEISKEVVRFFHSFRSFPAWKGCFAGLMGYVGWHALITGLAPPTDWDVLEYHLALPKLYLAQGRIGEIPWHLHNHWPHLIEMLYAVPLILGHDNMAALIHGTMCAALLLATFYAGREFLDETSAWIAIALLACQSIFYHQAGTALDDGAHAFFYFLAVVAVWRWAQTHSRKWLMMAGVLVGFTAAAKLFGIVLLASLGIWIMLRSNGKQGLRPENSIRDTGRHMAAQYRGQGSTSSSLGSLTRRRLRPKNIVWDSCPRGCFRGRVRWRETAWFFGCGLVVAGPWYLRTWIGTGNPVWPFFPRLLGGRWGAELIGMPGLSSILRWDWPSLKWLLWGDGVLYLLGPAAIVSAAALIQRKPWPPFLKLLLVPMIPYLVVVSNSLSVWRYSFPLMPGLALITGWWASQYLRRNAWRRGWVIAVVAFGLSPILKATQNNQLFAALHIRSMSEPNTDPRTLYLTRSLDQYRIIQEINHQIREPAKILLFEEIRGYYLDVDYEWGDPQNQGLIPYAFIKDPDDLRRRLAELHITHVLVNKGNDFYQAFMEQNTPMTLRLMDAMLRRYSEPVLKDGSLTLYALNRAPFAKMTP